MGDGAYAWFGRRPTTTRVVDTAREAKKMLPVGNAQLQTFGGYIDGDGGKWARIKVTYSTINNGWRRQWKAVGGWRGWGAMTTMRVDDGDRADNDALASSLVLACPRDGGGSGGADPCSRQQQQQGRR
jgi:hypothetical protein